MNSLKRFTAVTFVSTSLICSIGAVSGYAMDNPKKFEVDDETDGVKASQIKRIEDNRDKLDYFEHCLGERNAAMKLVKCCVELDKIEESIRNEDSLENKYKLIDEAELKLSEIESYRQNLYIASLLKKHCPYYEKNKTDYENSMEEDFDI